MSMMTIKKANRLVFKGLGHVVIFNDVHIKTSSIFTNIYLHKYTAKALGSDTKYLIELCNDTH